MKLVIQRVTNARVRVEEIIVGKIGAGLCVFIGVAPTDTEQVVRLLVAKMLHLRIFNSTAGKMNRSLLDIGGGLLAVPQFTLYADCIRGRRPSFTQAAAPETAKRIYEYFISYACEMGAPVERGVFGADMSVEIENDGPATFILDSEAMFNREAR